MKVLNTLINQLSIKGNIAMKKSNTVKSSFTHNDTMYEQYYDYNCIYEKLEDAVTYNDDL